MPRPAPVTAETATPGPERFPKIALGGNEEDVVAGDRVGIAGSPILTGQNQVGFAEVTPAHRHAQSLQPVLALRESRRVDQPDRPAVKIGRRLDRVAGRAGNFGYQRAIRAEQSVEQGRLAGIGRPRQDHDGPFPNPGPGGRAGEQL